MSGRQNRRGCPGQKSQLQLAQAFTLTKVSIHNGFERTGSGGCFKRIADTIVVLIDWQAVHQPERRFDQRFPGRASLEGDCHGFRLRQRTEFCLPAESIRTPLSVAKCRAGTSTQESSVGIALLVC